MIPAAPAVVDGLLDPAADLVTGDGIRLGSAGAAEATWANRRMLLTGADRLGAKQWRRLGELLDRDDPTDEIGGAWRVAERPQMLLGESEPSKIRWRLADFYEAAIEAAMPETVAGHHDRDLVASSVGRAGPPTHERAHRGVQPDHQTSETGTSQMSRETSWLRLPEHGQLRTPYHDQHCGHPTAMVSSMNRGQTLLKFEGPPTRV